ncbi:MAG: RagB/SusD family nutrient uptake outer membrane protein [Bernardetiaceae bacterium]|jgi:tetratricopeptide (TPR) repeat protein|nr:RagB/SusD family nutrient uptake outer membrane protein [Bernardetiaceae bacterium]
MKIKASKWATFGLLVALGCSSKDLDKVNPNLVTNETFFKDGPELVTAVNSTYALLQSFSLVAREYWFLHDLRSDDMASGGGQLETPRNQLLTGVHDPANFVMNVVWGGLYRTIHRANTVIQNAPRAQADDALRRRVVAEAKFVRAFAYFELVSMWGGVPLYREVVNTTGETQPRATADAVYQLVIDDLTAIQNDLPASYTGSDVGRATRGAAQALLGKVYLQRGNHAQAKVEFDKVINSNTYRLVNNYLDNFLEETENNPESVFEVGFSKIGDFNWSTDGDGLGNETTARSQEYAAVGWRNLIPSNSLLEEFEKTSQGDAKTDPRYFDSFYFVGDMYNNGTRRLDSASIQGNISVIHGQRRLASWRKYSAMYKTADTYYTSGINFRLIRYADVLLMSAEAEALLGNLQVAVQRMNQVRARASVAMPPYPTAKFPVGSRAEVLRALFHERRVELSGEQTRNRDILRWRAQRLFTAEPLSYFQANRHELLPLPQEELDNNDKIDQSNQNPGY